MNSTNQDAGNHLLLAYMADLELEIDRLRKHGNFIHFQVRDSLKRIQLACSNAKESANYPPAIAEISQTVNQLSGVVQDLRELPSYHPAHDQVIAVAMRPLVEQVFRWQQRLENAPTTKLHLELGCHHIEWFPARLRHILDTLIANALKYRDLDSKDSWVRFSLRESPETYELIIADNGTGVPAQDLSGLAGLLLRAAPVHNKGLSVGLAVVKLLIEQSGGTMNVESAEGNGAAITVVLPRFEIHDYLT